MNRWTRSGVGIRGESRFSAEERPVFAVATPSIACGVLLAGAILLAILLPGCSKEPTPSPVAKKVCPNREMSASSHSSS